MAAKPLAWFVSITSVRRLAELEKKQADLIAKQADEIQALKDWVTALEAREGSWWSKRRRRRAQQHPWWPGSMSQVSRKASAALKAAWR